MSVIIKRVWNQNKMVNIESLHGMAFQAEDGGHVFEISGVNDAGETVPLSGTVAGVFMRPDRADIALTGTASGGVASVTLTDDCYAVPGRFGLTIFVTEGGKKTAVYAAVGTVSTTSGGGVAGDTPQSVVDLINAIAAAVATIPASYSDLMASIAPMYSSSSLYPVGSYAWYDGTLYRCTTAITTAEAWTAAHWVSTTLGNIVTSLRGTLDSNADMNTITNPGIYSVDSETGFPDNLPDDPHNGRVIVFKSLSSYASVVQVYFTNYVRKRIFFRTSKSAISVSDAWNGVKWTEITTEDIGKGIDTINGKRVRVPLIPAGVQSDGRYGAVSTTRIRPVNSYNGLFDFKLAGYKIKFYYYSSKYDYDEATEAASPANFLYTNAWQDIDNYVSPDRGMWFVFQIGKQDDGTISATDLEYVRNNLEVYSKSTPDIYMQTNTVPYNAVTYHAMWNSLVDGSVVRRTLLGNVDNSANYPIYAYEINVQRNALDQGYNEVHYDGTNALYPRKKVLIFAGQHGGEKCTPMDVLALARELVKGGLQDVGAMFDWHIIPLVNPWGYSHVHLAANGNIIYRYGQPVASTVEATADLNAGVRENASGIDINRDFSDNTYISNGVTFGWQSQEAQIIKPYLLANKWDIFIDCHQNNRDKNTNMSNACDAYCGIAWKTSEDSDYIARLNKAYLAIDIACRNTNKKLSEYFRREHPYQALVLWQRTPCDSGSVDLGTAVNYMGGIPTGTHGNTEHNDIAADVAITLETSELAWTYSQLSNQTNTPYVSWYNPIACTCSTTALCELVKSIANSYAFLV